MFETQNAIVDRELQAETARADLQRALSALRDQLTPGEIMKAAGRSARSAAIPLLDPVLSKAKSSGGSIALIAAGAALLFELGRSHKRAVAMSEHKQATSGVADNAADINSAGKVSLANSAGDVSQGSSSGSAARSGTRRRKNNLIKVALVAAAGLAAGVAASTVMPISEQERRIAKSAVQTAKDLAAEALKNHGDRAAVVAGNAFGLASAVGMAVNVMTLVSLFAQRMGASANQKNGGQSAG